MLSPAGNTASTYHHFHSSPPPPPFSCAKHFPELQQLSGKTMEGHHSCDIIFMAVALVAAEKISVFF